MLEHGRSGAIVTPTTDQLYSGTKMDEMFPNVVATFCQRVLVMHNVELLSSAY